MKKLYLIILTLLHLALSLNSLAQMQMEFLNRGLVAIREGNGYFLTWRLLGHEPFNTGFNIYRDGQQVNATPVVDVTTFLDPVAPLNAVYTVRAIINGNEMVACRSARVINSREGTGAFFDIALQRPPTGPRGGTYSPGDASVADLDGDGEFEIVLKWDPSNQQDNSINGHTDNVFIDAYTLEGVRRWRIDLGMNIRAGAHYTQFLVYDFDGNGRAELMVKTAPGTRDGTGNFISMGPAATAEHTRDFSNAGGRILDGPEFITVFDGLTGAELATSNYWPARGDLRVWGDDWGNRADRFNAAVAYLDGERPSAVFQRGYYGADTRHFNLGFPGRMAFAAWDWRNGTLSLRWTFDTQTTGNAAFIGQGNHSLHVIDANGDGRHDLVTGAAVIGADGRGMHTSGRGHGDATHVTYMIKDNPRPLIFMPYESGGHGVSLRYADNGLLIFNHRLAADVGRGVAAELDPARPGFHFWGSGGLGLYNINGAVVGSVPNSINHVVWWDGDLSRELLDQNRVDKWSIVNGTANRLLTANGATSINGTKANPVLQADLFGDWREEIIFRRADDLALRVYTTAMLTTHRLFTLMHDPVYRVAISWQNSSYNQPPHPGFYLASDMDFPPPAPSVSLVRGVNRGSGTVIRNLMVEDIPNSAGWSVKNSLLSTEPAYGDMNIFVTPMPTFLESAEWASPDVDSRRLFTRDVVAEFTAAQNATLYLLHCQVITLKPAWLKSGWVTTGQTVRVANAGGASRQMDLFTREVLANEIIRLGINSNDGTPSALMYLLAAVPVVPSQIDSKLDNQLSMQVHPNPFSHRANVTFSLPRPGDVSVEMFDINGRLVQIVARETMVTGTRTVSIDGEGLAPGVYVIRLVAGNQVAMQKVIVR